MCAFGSDRVHWRTQLKLDIKKAADDGNYDEIPILAESIQQLQEQKRTPGSQGKRGQAAGEGVVPPAVSSPIRAMIHAAQVQCLAESKGVTEETCKAVTPVTKRKHTIDLPVCLF
jgi:hypothetical protein